MTRAIKNPELARQYQAFTEAMTNCDDVDMRYIWKLKRDDVVRRDKEQSNAQAI
jgi:hypothetical protein|tara:strand:+ start:115 stop:276 length:162 start_codon:yes stop_codon:yes gene_type:complete